MADSGVRSLAPLRGCNKLRKLDVRGCHWMVVCGVADLQLICTQLANRASVELEGQVHELSSRMPAALQQRAMKQVVDKMGKLEAQTAIAAAGAIPFCAAAGRDG
jgi:hypothetical protein